MAAVEERLGEVVAEAGGPVRTGARRLREAAGHLALAPAAKRARPRLVLHFGRSVGLEPVRLVAFAVAAELVHTASLLHDDVVDAGTERRERPTVNSRWSDVTAVLTGDALLCSALRVLRDAPSDVTDRAVDTVAEMTRSILHEIACRRRTDLERDDWQYIAAGKTGALFGWCGAAPALEAGAPRTAERLEECGRRLGVAFQLADDLRDVMPVDSGKDAFADIRNGHPSYPLICAIDEQPEVADQLTRLWTDRDRPGDQGPTPARIAETVRASGAIDETRARIQSEVDEALEALGSHTERPGGAHIANWARRLCARL